MSAALLKRPRDAQLSWLIGDLCKLDLGRAGLIPRWKQSQDVSCVENLRRRGKRTTVIATIEWGRGTSLSIGFRVLAM